MNQPETMEVELLSGIKVTLPKEQALKEIEHLECVKAHVVKREKEAAWEYWRTLSPAAKLEVSTLTRAEYGSVNSTKSMIRSDWDKLPPKEKAAHFDAGGTLRDS